MARSWKMFKTAPMICGKYARMGKICSEKILKTHETRAKYAQNFRTCVLWLNMQKKTCRKHVHSAYFPLVPYFWGGVHLERKSRIQLWDQNLNCLAFHYPIYLPKFAAFSHIWGTKTSIGLHGKE